MFFPRERSFSVRDVSILVSYSLYYVYDAVRIVYIQVLVFNIRTTSIDLR